MKGIPAKHGDLVTAKAKVAVAVLGGIRLNRAH